MFLVLFSILIGNIIFFWIIQTYIVFLCTTTIVKVFLDLSTSIVISVLICSNITLYSVPPVTGVGLCVEDSALGTEEAVSEEDTKSRDAPVEDLAARGGVCIVRT